jgi:anti-sigma B factor antagonist
MGTVSRDDGAASGRIVVSTSQPAPDLAVAEIRGEVDTATSPQLKEQLDAVIAGGPRRFVVDLAGVTFFSSSGITVLLQLQSLCADAAVRVVFVVSPTLRRLLGIVGLQEVLPLSASRDEALASLDPRISGDDRPA